MDQRGAADALAAGLGFVPLEPGLHGVHALREAAGGDAQPLGRNVTGLVGVDAAKLDGRDPGGLGQHVDGALDGKGGLGVAVAPHGLGVGIVGVDARGLEAHVGHAIQSGDGHHHHRGRGGAPGGVGAVVQDHPDVPEKEFSVPVAALGDVGDGGLPRRGGEKFLGAVELDFDRPPGVIGQQDGNVLVRIGVELAAEPAADAGFDHPHPALLQPHHGERLQEIFLGQRRDLSVGVDREMVGRVEFRDRPAGAHAAVGHPGGGEPLAHREGRRLAGGLDVAVVELPGHSEHIGLVPFVHQGRPLAHGGFRVEDRRQRLIGDLDQLQGLPGGLRIDRRDGRDFVPIRADLAFL